MRPQLLAQAQTAHRDSHYKSPFAQCRFEILSIPLAGKKHDRINAVEARPEPGEYALSPSTPFLDTHCAEGLLVGPDFFFGMNQAVLRRQDAPRATRLLHTGPRLSEPVGGVEVHRRRGYFPFGLHAGDQNQPAYLIVDHQKFTSPTAAWYRASAASRRPGTAASRTAVVRASAARVGGQVIVGPFRRAVSGPGRILTEVKGAGGRARIRRPIIVPRTGLDRSRPWPSGPRRRGRRPCACRQPLSPPVTGPPANLTPSRLPVVSDALRGNRPPAGRAESAAVSCAQPLPAAAAGAGSRRLAAAARHRRDRAIVVLAFCAGLRRSEIAALIFRGRNALSRLRAKTPANTGPIDAIQARPGRVSGSRSRPRSPVERHRVGERTRGRRGDTIRRPAADAASQVSVCASC